MMDGFYQELAEAYARGMLPDAEDSAGGADLLKQARAAGLKLHRFKRTMDLPRVRAVLGALRGLAPESLVDFGSGRGVFLWPLLDAFPALPVTAVERDERRLGHLEAVRRGGIERLSVVRGDASRLTFADRSFDGATVLEVLEHQDDPLPLAREAVRLARRFVIASVPSGATERQSLFWAALLHDVAKPATTRIEPDGRVIAPGHSRRGQIMARRILADLGAPYTQRELICHLITHHQIPFYLLERERPERRAHRISHQTRCDLLAILATADARGRICPDGPRLLDNIALFRELCREEGCLARPKAFASDHSRFLYFRREDRSAGYEAFDDWHGAVTLMSGLPGSGKDSWLATHAGDMPVISLDDLRAELGIDPADTQGPVIAAAREQARVHLRAERSFIWNATNVSRQLRSQLIDLFADYRAKVRIVYVEAPLAEAARRNQARARPVPRAAIARMLDRWEPPDLTECHVLETVLT